MAERDDSSPLRREVGFFSATVLVVANMIGTGVFTTSGFVMGELGSSALLLFAWAAGGIFALAGAFCYAELGSMFPKSGGDYVFLRESFGRIPAFLSGWVSLIVGFSAPVAAASIAFAGYLLGSDAWVTKQFCPIDVSGLRLFSISPASFLACAMVVAFTVVHTRGIDFSARVQNVLTAFKFILIATFVVAGFCLGGGDAANFTATADSFVPTAGGVASALVFVSFAYSGWNAAAYIGGEIRNPERNLPRALLVGTGLVTLLYLLVNAVYIYALTPGEMTGVVEVGGLAASVLFGGMTGRLFSVAVAIGLLSVISAMTLAGPRVYYAMAREGDFFAFFGKVDPGQRTPARAVVLQSTISILMILTTAFDTLLIYIGVLLSLSALMTVAGMMRLRFLRPELARPYRCFAYPFTPLAFIAGSALVAAFSLWSRPIVLLYAGMTLLVGLCVARIARIQTENVKATTSPATAGNENLALSETCPIAER